VVSERVVESVEARVTEVGGQAGVVVVVRGRMPALGLWGPGIEFSVEGHAVKETGE
jgi:hypothetical protein